MELQQALNIVRTEIISVMNVDARTGGGGFVVEPSNRYRRKKLVDEVTKQEVFDRDPYQATATRPHSGSSCPLPENAFLLTRTTRAINMLTPDLKSLAYFAYDQECKWDHVETVARELWAAFLKAQPKALREKKLKTLKGMTYLAMQNWQHVLTAAADLHEPARIRELLDISAHQWRRDWLPFWRQFHELLSLTDRRVLLNVYQSAGKAAADSSEAAAA